jgi:hypothetical protein
VARRDYVLNNMVGRGIITEAQAATAKAEPVEIIGNETPNGCTGTTNPTWGFYCDFFQRWWLQQEVFGATTYDRERQLRSGGYRIVSTLDVHIQNGMHDAVIKARSVNDPNALMLGAIEPGSGKVRGLAVNRNFRLDDKKNPQNGPHTNPIARAQGIRGSYPNTTNPLLSTDPDFQGYRPGSVMKIFTMVAALENGFPLDYTINTQPRAVSKYRYTGDPNCGGWWCPPNNAGTPIGPHTMWTAFGFSREHLFRATVRRGRWSEGHGHGTPHGPDVLQRPDPAQRQRLHKLHRPADGQRLVAVHARHIHAPAPGDRQRVCHPRGRRLVL